MTDSAQHYNIQGGVHCTDFVGRDKVTNQYGFSAEDAERIIAKMLEFVSSGATFAPREDGALQAEWDGQLLTFQPKAAQTLAGRRCERSYLLALTLHKDYQEWATNFIPLKANVMERKVAGGALDIPLAYLAVRQPPPGSGREAQNTTEPLDNITEALDRHDAFIILGEPSCGKTTISASEQY